MMVRQSKIGSSLESKELVVFDILRDSKCSECGKELGKGDFLFMEGKHPVCLSCADFDHLIYLPRGDAALTRRAKKYSALSAIVVRFSRSRGRYERQGILVEDAWSAPNKNALRMPSSVRDAANGTRCGALRMTASSRRTLQKRF
jgi:hypothetical protein